MVFFPTDLDPSIATRNFCGTSGLPWDTELPRLEGVHVPLVWIYLSPCFTSPFDVSEKLRTLCRSWSESIALLGFRLFMKDWWCDLLDDAGKLKTRGRISLTCQSMLSAPGGIGESVVLEMLWLGLLLSLKLDRQTECESEGLGKALGSGVGSCGVESCSDLTCSEGASSRYSPRASSCWFS